MSRTRFREALGGPRPPAAYGLAATASLALAVTGEIAPPVLFVAAAGLALALRRRSEPRPWQHSGALLTAGALAAAGAGALLWWQGRLAMVALAHFALLAQPLQLLDARPRRSEFLLVALALFQVVLAANLTASLLFPPLLAVFIACAVWTLLVHTLRAEALEAGEPEAARRALTAGLRRTAVWASLLTFLGAILLFPLLPRLGAGALLGGGSGGGSATSGFSESVELGAIGRIRHDPTVVLRVETLEGEPREAGERYWRGLAFDRFDGRSWSVTPSGRERVARRSEGGVDLGGRQHGARVVQRIVREGLGSGVLFAPGRPLALAGALGALARDAGGALYAESTAGRRIAYRVEAEVGRPAPAALRRDRARPPGPNGRRYLRIPEALAPRLRALARELAAGAETDAARARALEEGLRQRGRYTDDPPRAPEGSDRSPVMAFLEGGMEGHCEYFATSMALLARAQGLPARVVNGFAGGSENRLGGFVELAQADAHTWVEIHYAGAGWVRYDPTPPDLRLAGARSLGERPTLADLASAAQHWWFRNVVDFDRRRQANALRDAWLAWRSWRGAEARPSAARSAEGRGGPDLPALPGWLWAALAASALGALALRRGLRPSPSRRRAPLPDFYARALRLLARRGHVRAPSAPARRFAERAGAKLSPAGAAALAELTEAYLAQRFGGRPAPRLAEARRALRALRDSLRG